MYEKKSNPIWSINGRIFKFIESIIVDFIVDLVKQGQEVVRYKWAPILRDMLFHSAALQSITAGNLDEIIKCTEEISKKIASSIQFLNGIEKLNDKRQTLATTEKCILNMFTKN